MDEPESKGAITIATREKLDNLVFVINCNLQRLDGPVTGNGKIINELEGIFSGAGWQVLKVIWGGRWDELLRKDTSGKLVQLMNETLDGDYQTFKSKDGAYVREHFFGRSGNRGAGQRHDRRRNLGAEPWWSRSEENLRCTEKRRTPKANRPLTPSKVTAWVKPRKVKHRSPGEENEHGRGSPLPRSFQRAGCRC